jgi:hypothetical protein
VVPGVLVALAASALSLGVAGPANAATIDVQGTVTGVAGAKLEGIHVEAYDAATNEYLGTNHTDVNGHYQFEDLTATSVKLWFDDESSFEFTNDIQYLDRWHGGSRYRGNASVTPIATDGETAVNMAMTPTAVLSGSVAAVDGHALTGNYSTDVVDSDLNYPSYDEARDGMNFRLAIDPGTYRVGGYGYDNPPVGDDINYLEKWWTDSDTPVGATPLTVAAGQTVGGINLRVTDKLSARQAPQIGGVAAVGRPLTATPGTWSRNAGTEFSYTWKRGATVVGTGATYAPTVADFNQRLNVVVRALNGEHAGEAASAQTEVVRYPADARSSAKALGGRKVRFGVKIVSARQSPVKGKVVVMRGNRVVHSAVKLVKGKAVITVKGQPKGRQTFTVLYKGNSVLSQATKAVTVRVR